MLPLLSSEQDLINTFFDLQFDENIDYITFYFTYFYFQLKKERKRYWENDVT